MKPCGFLIEEMMKASDHESYWSQSDVFFPELFASKMTIQRSGDSVWKHTMAVLGLLHIKNPITLMAGLFHDLGKTSVPPNDDPSPPRFPGHADESAKIAMVRLTRWGAHPCLIDSVLRLVSTHMYDISGPVRPQTIRGFVAKIGVNNVENWFALRIADSRSYAAHNEYYSRFIEPFRDRVYKHLDRLPHSTIPQFDIGKSDNSIQIRGSDSE